jgi:hypothetical protein
MKNIMKRLIFIVYTFFISIFSLAQGGSGGTYPDNELTIQIKNVINRTITFEMVPIGSNWAKTDLSGCNIALYNNNTIYISSLEGGSNGWVDCYYNGFEYRYHYEGNYTDIFGCAQSTAGLKPLRNGFYRINVKENNVLKAYAYFDWRDIGFPASCNYCPKGNDMTIRYDGLDEKIWFWNQNSISNTNDNPDLKLTNGQIITWTEWQCDIRKFSPFWNHGLVLLDDNFNPKIVWVPFGDQQYFIHGYRIYRAITSNSVPPPTPNFSLLTTTNSNEFSFIDYDYGIGGPLRIYYKVTAMYSFQDEEDIFESEPTNVVVTNGGLYKSFNKDFSKPADFNLFQNFPNPFNPSTTISYQVSAPCLIKIKICNSLGKEVKELVNEYKDEGFYTENFNAVGLTS